MSLARCFAIALQGLRGRLVEVEADLSPGLPGLTFTGLADTSVVEARERIRAAIGNSGVEWPNRRVTVALLPAHIRKVGSGFDLALAVAVLACTGQLPMAALHEVVWIAEVGLDGRLRPVPGVLPAVVAALDSGIRRVVVAPANAAEAALVDAMDVRAPADLRELIAWLRGEVTVAPATADDAGGPDEAAWPDLVDVAGQATAKRALEVAAAGSHHLFMLGPPGAGKTMLAERLPGLLPELDDAAALEVTAVHSVAGLLGAQARLVRRPPLQAPHHTATVAALVGGGSHLGRPGAISLAHHGVLFLDEAPEFSPRALDALRQPLEGGTVVIHRGGGAVTYPARFQLVLAANPCPCGARSTECVCPPQVRRRYRQRLSGPLLDRVDVRVRIEAVASAELLGPSSAVPAGETSAVVAGRVRAARAAAAERWAGHGWQVNAAAPGAELRSGRWRLPAVVIRPAETYLERGQLTARGFDRILRLSWSVADLAGHSVPDAGDVAEALFFRTGDRSAA